MPSNLYQLIRYRSIDKSLRNLDQDWTWERLTEACMQAIKDQTGEAKEVSRRTLMYDISNMRSGKLGYSAPIEYDRKEKTYYYSNSNFSIVQVPVRQADMDELKNALRILQQFSGKAGVHGLQRTITHLEECLNIKKKGRPKKPIIQFDHSLNEKGQRWVNTVYKMIQEKSAFTAEYHPFDHDSSHITFSPYLLKEYNNRWFVIGYHHGKEGVGVLGLDRIENIKDSLSEHTRVTDFDEDTYFNNVIGVSYAYKKEIKRVVFRVYGIQNRYIKTKPFHESQKIIKETKAYTDYELQVVPNFELQTVLLSYAERIEVISPKSLKMEMKDRLKKATANYS